MLDSLRRIVHEVSAAGDLQEALAVIVERVKTALKADVCSVYLNDPESGDHILMATDGLRPGAVGKVRLAAGDGLVGLVARRAELLNLDNAADHPSFQFVAATGEAPFHGFLGVPVIRRGKIVGVLVVQQRLSRKFTSDEEAFLATLAAQLAGSITLAEVRQGLDQLDTGHATTTIFLEGVASARGLGFGEAVVIFAETALEAVPDKQIYDCEAEVQKFRDAVVAETTELSQLADRLGRILSPGDRALFDAYALLLSSDSLVNGVIRRINQGNWAPGALRATITELADVFEEMDDPYLQGRAADIRDLGRRLLKRLRQETTTARSFPEKTILMGEEVGVTDFFEIPPERLAGLVSVRGTGASHVALLARGMGIPAVFGLNNAPLDRLNGREVVVDGYSARVCVQPGPALRQEYLKLIHEENELFQGLEPLRELPAQTPDGVNFAIFANSGLFADIVAARDRGAEGVGLYRSELHFFLRDRFPGEDEQTATYTRVLQTMAPRPVALRTLDVGGDKPLPYFPISEENPFLGWRGIRISLDQPDIFKTQLRAMLRASLNVDNMSLLFPMITCVSELDAAILMLRHAHEELNEDGLQISFPRIGVMIEVPSAAFSIDALAQRVDFISIGSNDLTQYLLAVDRNNDRVAKLYDSLHPAVIWTVKHIVKQSHKLGKPVTVCGEMAGDPAGALLLMGMGIDCLSMSMGNLLKIKWVVRTINCVLARSLLSEALQMAEAEQVRRFLNTVLEEHGLGGLVRAGK